MWRRRSRYRRDHRLFLFLTGWLAGLIWLTRFCFLLLFHCHFQVLTAALKSGKCVSAAKLAANSLMSLGSDAARPALRPLIEAFQVVHLRPVRADLLRALAALCSSADIIQEFETVRLNIAYVYRRII